MELPKNITQIGESDSHCKIYVEDYVISYMKQLNQLAMDKDMAVALYGIRKEENEVSYLFLYGACKLTFLQRETRHLSQAQQQEIEKLRRKYFKEYTFLGYRLLNGEMIEGIHICEQDICRYISGYAQFYEKNDSMLAYMLDVREETVPETFDQEKYDVVKKKQEERRIQHEDAKRKKSAPPDAPAHGVRGMRVAVVAVFALLCAIGLTTINGDGKVEEWQTMARQMMDGALEQRLPDAADEAEEGKVDTLITEDKLAEAVLQENENAPSLSSENGTSVPEQEIQQVSAPGVAVNDKESEEQNTALDPVTDPAATITPEMPEPQNETPGTQNETPTSETTLPSETDQDAAEEQPVFYTIKEGDTLIGISLWKYGSGAKVSDICEMNQITNPDDIKVGQKILLP